MIGGIFVKFNSRISREQAEKLVREHGGTVLTWSGGDTESTPSAMVRVTPGEEDDKVEELLGLPCIAGAYLNFDFKYCLEG